MIFWKVVDDTYKGLSGSGAVFVLGTGDHLNVNEGCTLSTIDDDYIPVFSSFNALDITIAGLVSVAFDTAISLGVFENRDFQVTVTETGMIEGVTNAIAMYGSNANVLNSGMIVATETAIRHEQGSGTDTFQVINSGTIKGDTTAILNGADAGEATYIENKGTIEGTRAFDNLSSASAEIRNTGTMIGTIHLGNGKDTYSGAGGKASGMIYGMDGNDVFTGGTRAESFQGDAGRDTMTGNGGADTFVFVALSDSTGGNTALDRIRDFSHKQNDTIDLSGLDAHSTKSGNQNFTFIGDSDSPGKTGQLWYEIIGSTTYVRANTDRDSQAEFSIALTGKLQLVASDFDL